MCECFEELRTLIFYPRIYTYKIIILKKKLYDLLWIDFDVLIMSTS